MSHSLLTHVAEADFETQVLGSSTPVLVDFGATWCGPCKAQLPLLEALALEQGARLKVVEVDIDESPALALRYGVKGAPTLLVFKDGQVTARQFGLANKRRLLEMVGA